MPGKCLRFTCYVRDIGSFKSRLCKIVYSKEYNIFNTLCMVVELVIKPKTMTLNKHLALHNWHLLALRTGQSGVTNFYFLTQSHSILLYDYQVLKMVLIVKLQPLSVLSNHSVKFLGKFQVLK